MRMLNLHPPRRTVLRDRRELERDLARFLRRRRLPDCFLYVGGHSSQAWSDLDGQEDFPIASRLETLLAGSVEQIAARAAAAGTLVSLGCGEGRKERLLLEALCRQRRRMRYVAVDISSDLLDSAVAAVADLPVRTEAIVALCQDLPRLARRWRGPVLLCMLGNNFCNYPPVGMARLLAGHVCPQSLLLVDAHVRSGPPGPWRQRTERAYRSPANAAFNLLPLLQRGLAKDAARFELHLRRCPTPMGEAWRTHKRIRILRPSRLDLADGPLDLAGGEVIEMGFTYKFTPRQFAAALAGAGLHAVGRYSAGEDLLLLAASGG